MERWFPLEWRDLVTLAGIASIVFTIMKDGYGITGRIAGSFAVCLFVLAATYWSFKRVLSVMENRFSLVPAKPGGEEAYKEIKGADEVIRVTHFTTDPPTKAYTKFMLKRMKKRKINVIRIVAIDSEEEPEIYTWLEQFRAHRRYTEYQYQGKPLPMDFMIFDEKKVIIYLSRQAGSKEFDRAIKFDNHEVALVFIAMFDRLIHDPESKRTH